MSQREDIYITISPSYYCITQTGYPNAIKYMKRDILCSCVRKFPPPVNSDSFLETAKQSNYYKTMMSSVHHDSIITNRVLIILSMHEISICEKCSQCIVRCKLCKETGVWNSVDYAILTIINRFMQQHIICENNIKISAWGVGDVFKCIRGTHHSLNISFPIDIYVSGVNIIQRRALNYNLYYFVKICNVSVDDFAKRIYETTIGKIINCYGNMAKYHRSPYNREISDEILFDIITKCGFEYGCSLCGLYYENFPSEDVYVSHMRRCKKTL